MLTLEYIQDKMHGYYPNSTLLTPEILAEMFGRLQRLNWTEETFDSALQAYRADPNRNNDRTPHRIPPTVQQLITGHERGKSRQVVSAPSSARDELFCQIAISESYWQLIQEGKLPVGEHNRERVRQRILQRRQEYLKFGKPYQTRLSPELNALLDQLPPGAAPPNMEQERHDNVEMEIVEKEFPQNADVEMEIVGVEGGNMIPGWTPPETPDESDEIPF